MPRDHSVHPLMGEDARRSAPGPYDMQVVLASASPRRQQLLSTMGLTFQVVVTDVDETVRPNEGPSSLVGRLSYEKAQAAITMLTPDQAGAIGAASIRSCVIAADTIVVAPDDRTILGKPASLDQAREMLVWLRNKKHRVYSGITLVDARRDRQCTLVAYTDVHMRPYSDQELSRYIASGDPLDKAGAYAIQHDGFAPIDHLENCYTNVMGLPLCHLYRALQDWCEQDRERQSAVSATAGIRHPLACCPYALEHAGCPWAADILAGADCADRR